MSSAQLEEEMKQYEEQRELVVASLKDDAGNAELLALKEELDQMIKLIDDALAERKPKEPASKAAAATKTTPSSLPPRPPEKWSRENHPAFKKTTATPTPPAPPPLEEKEAEPLVLTYQVNDNVMAKWITGGDKGFYPARITAVTGSSTAPVYTVKFKSYDTTETLRAKDIRPMPQKRKADGHPAASSALAHATTTVSSGDAPVTQAGIVMSAGAEMYASAQQVAQAADGNEDDNPKKKVKKIKATKELEAGKSKWQEFSTKGKFGKGAKKDSMFRTPEGVHGRVGFTGSGQPMRKDVTRSRHIYQQNDELD